MAPLVLVAFVALLGLGTLLLRRVRARALAQIRARWGQSVNRERKMQAIAESHRSRLSNMGRGQRSILVPGMTWTSTTCSRLSTEQRARSDSTPSIIACGPFRSLTISTCLKCWSAALNPTDGCENEHRRHFPVYEIRTVTTCGGSRARMPSKHGRGTCYFRFSLPQRSCCSVWHCCRHNSPRHSSASL